MYRYIDGILFINNDEFEIWKLGQMYPTELNIKDTTENKTSALNRFYTCIPCHETDYLW